MWSRERQDDQPIPMPLGSHGTEGLTRRSWDDPYGPSLDATLARTPRMSTDALPSSSRVGPGEARLVLFSHDVGYIGEPITG
jgi:hypothetical protein